MPEKGLSKEELSWVLTLNVDALEANSSAQPSLMSPTWKTAPSSPSWIVSSEASASSASHSPTMTSASSPPVWKDLPLIPPSKELKARERRVRNRQHAKISRERKKEYEQVMQARVAEIERENAALRAELERELQDNRRLKEELELDMYECVWT